MALFLPSPSILKVLDSCTTAPLTGKAPEYLYGIPFPTVSENDPDAGIKALWNQFNVYWHQGNVNAETLL